MIYNPFIEQSDHKPQRRKVQPDKPFVVIAGIAVIPRADIVAL
jgi:hypothetical protein